MRFNRKLVGSGQWAVGSKTASGRVRAFTLIELMIVVVILGLLTSVAVYSYSRYLDKAKQMKARTDISVFVGGIDQYNGEKGKYPDNSEGLKALVPEYIKSLPNDPWGRPYQYVQPGKTSAYDIISYGADGREGGTGADQDITNNDKEALPPKK
jgi:general secretion pathway protein G